MSSTPVLLAGSPSGLPRLLACLDRHELTADANAICAAWCVTLADAHGRRRFNDVTRARHRLWVLLRDRTGLSYPQIGALFGRDHSSVLHACKLWERTQAALFLSRVAPTCTAVCRTDAAKDHFAT